MKKITSIILAFSIIAAMALMTACGGSAQSQSGSADSSQSETTAAQASDSSAPDAIEGDYALYAIGEDGVYYGAEEYYEFMNQLISSLGSLAEDSDSDTTELPQIDSMGIIINADGTASLTVMDEEADCVWTYENGKFTLKSTESDDDETAQSYEGTLENGILTIEGTSGEGTMIFAKDGADTSEIETQSLEEAMGASASE